MLLSVFKSAVYLLLVAWATHVAANFQLYKLYSQDALIAGLALSDKCLEALNATVRCNETAVNLLGDGADIHYWTTPEVKNLCTKDCVSSLDSWRSNVDKVCDEETTVQAGVIVKARALPLTFTYNADLVCTQDKASNWCFVDSQKWQGSDYIRYDPVMCFANGDDNSTVSPECDDPEFDVDVITDEMAALTNIYDGELYCSECFLKLYRQRLLDPWLPVTNFTDYLIKEFDSMQKNCSTTLSYRTSASTLYVGPATTTTSTTTSGNATGTTSASSTTSTSSTATPTCLGQEVKPLDNWLTCNDLCDKYNISTGDARVYTGDYGCYFKEPVCLPLPCELDVVWDQPSCDKLAERYSNKTDKITTNQFLSWNPNIQGSCSGIARGQRVCKTAPGGIHHHPNRTITTHHTRTVRPSHPTQSGTTPHCGRYHLVVPGDDCSTLAQRFGLTPAQLREYNAFLKPDCRNLWLGYDVCVASVTEEEEVVVSGDRRCGKGVRCEVGECCSEWGFCGSGGEYCAHTNGTETTDGTCGPENGGATCAAPFGECCSIYGFCGDGDDFCGAGNCYSGACEADIGGPSTDGACGPDFAGNKTCAGTQFGKCCSMAGYCGSTSEFCARDNCYSGECT